MSSPRERLLAEGINNKLISIQKSYQIYKKLNKWEKKVLLMDEKRIEEVSRIIAKKVEIFTKNIETNDGHPLPKDIMKKIQEEIGRAS